MALLETETSLKPPQISGMFQKLALAFKTKTIEFFADEVDDDANEISLVDSSDEIITGQRVVVIKPDHAKAPPPLPSPPQYQLQTLIPSLFATVSSFNASYLHLQTAHAPFDADGIEAADRAAVSHLQRLSDIKRSYFDPRRNPNPSSDLPLVSHLEAQVQENQSLLRSFDTVINRLQSDIDRKDAEVSALRQRLESNETTNERLSKRLEDFDAASSSSSEFLLSVSLFESVLQDACRAAHGFTKILIDLMKDAGWDLDSAASSVHPGVGYAKRGHNRYAILSYVCLVMFGGFDSERFCLGGDGVYSDLNLNSNSNNRRKKFLRQFVEHGYIDPLELLSSCPDCDFAKFCNIRYQELVHPNMESSLFGDFDRKELVLDSWRSSAHFYESFVGMASAVWMLHKLAFSFDPKVEIFQVERGNDFSMVFMESVIRKGMNSGSGFKTKAKVGFTVIPGFKVGKTVIQCRVYLNDMKSAE